MQSYTVSLILATVVDGKILTKKRFDTSSPYRLQGSVKPFAECLCMYFVPYCPERLVPSAVALGFEAAVLGENEGDVLQTSGVVAEQHVGVVAAAAE